MAVVQNYMVLVIMYTLCWTCLCTMFKNIVPLVLFTITLSIQFYTDKLADCNTQ